MATAGEEIIEMFKNKGKFALTSNREYWEELHFKKGKYYHVGGESLGGSEEFRVEITEDDVLDQIMRFLINHADTVEEIDLETEEEVLDYWMEKPNLG